MRLLALFVLLAVTASAAEVEIVRVFSGWREASSFKRIREYFTGTEYTGGETVARTQPGERGGYYFLVRTRNTGAQRDGTKFVLAVSTPGAHEPRRIEFTLPLAAGSRAYQLGLTGSDWPDPKTDAVAWKLEIVAADGTLLATEKSYLWDHSSGR